MTVDGRRGLGPASGLPQDADCAWCIGLVAWSLMATNGEAPWRRGGEGVHSTFQAFQAFQWPWLAVDDKARVHARHGHEKTTDDGNVNLSAGLPACLPLPAPGHSTEVGR